jgi:hypothetical protein
MWTLDDWWGGCTDINGHDRARIDVYNSLGINKCDGYGVEKGASVCDPSWHIEHGDGGVIENSGDRINRHAGVGVVGLWLNMTPAFLMPTRKKYLIEICGPLTQRNIGYLLASGRPDE